VVTTGNYTFIDITQGVATGNTYTQTADSGWEVDAFTTPTPTPTPSATPAPSPTPVPSISPVPSPTVTATPVMVTIYLGEYSVPSFAGSPSSGPYTAAATTGCFVAILMQPVGGTVGQIHFQRPAISEPPNMIGFGSPHQSGDFASTLLDSGPIDSFTITNLTTSSGTGVFTLSNGVMGTATITGSETEVSSPDILRSRALRQQLLRSSLGFDAWRTRGR